MIETFLEKRGVPTDKNALSADRSVGSSSLGDTVF